jgi:hypothetical protein
MHPDTDIQRPIDAGLKLSPPNSTGVDQMSGMRVIADASRNESTAKLAIVIRTGLVSNAVSGGGFCRSFGDAFLTSVGAWCISE